MVVAGHVTSFNQSEYDCCYFSPIFYIPFETKLKLHITTISIRRLFPSLRRHGHGLQQSGHPDGRVEWIDKFNPKLQHQGDPN